MTGWGTVGTPPPNPVRRPFARRLPSGIDHRPRVPGSALAIWRAPGGNGWYPTVRRLNGATAGRVVVVEQLRPTAIEPAVRREIPARRQPLAVLVPLPVRSRADRSAVREVIVLTPELTEAAGALANLGRAGRRVVERRTVEGRSALALSVLEIRTPEPRLVRIPLCAVARVLDVERVAVEGHRGAAAARRSRHELDTGLAVDRLREHDVDRLTAPVVRVRAPSVLGHTGDAATRRAVRVRRHDVGEVLQLVLNALDLRPAVVPTRGFRGELRRGVLGQHLRVPVGDGGGVILRHEDVVHILLATRLSDVDLGVHRRLLVPIVDLRPLVFDEVQLILVEPGRVALHVVLPDHGVTTAGRVHEVQVAVAVQLREVRVVLGDRHVLDRLAHRGRAGHVVD